MIRNDRDVLEFTQLLNALTTVYLQRNIPTQMVSAIQQAMLESLSRAIRERKADYVQALLAAQTIEPAAKSPAGKPPLISRRVTDDARTKLIRECTQSAATGRHGALTQIDCDRISDSLLAYSQQFDTHQYGVLPSVDTLPPSSSPLNHFGYTTIADVLLGDMIGDEDNAYAATASALELGDIVDPLHVVDTSVVLPTRSDVESLLQRLHVIDGIHLRTRGSLCSIGQMGLYSMVDHAEGALITEFMGDTLTQEEMFDALARGEGTERFRVLRAGLWVRRGHATCSQLERHGGGSMARDNVRITSSLAQGKIVRAANMPHNVRFVLVTHRANHNASAPMYAPLETHIVLVATRAISAGDELFVDYGTSFWTRRLAFRRERVYLILETGDDNDDTRPLLQITDGSDAN